MLDIHKIRQDFPILSREVYGKPLVYLDNAATSQKPRCIIETITDGYTRINANVHRGVHRLSQEATDGHEHARRRVQQFLHAAHDREIIFKYTRHYGIDKPRSPFVRNRIPARWR